MEEFYPQIRNVHIGAVIASGALFALRGLALNLFNMRWAMALPLRLVSYTIDTVLLTAALMLMTIVQQYPFVHAWLTAKVLLLIAYIVLGSFALKRGRTPRARLGFFLTALAVFGYVVTIARARDPLGLFAGAFA
jgi:uncharacterized membrane protein SirB2